MCEVAWRTARLSRSLWESHHCGASFGVGLGVIWSGASFGVGLVGLGLGMAEQPEEASGM